MNQYETPVSEELPSFAIAESILPERLKALRARISDGEDLGGQVELAMAIQCYPDYFSARADALKQFKAGIEARVGEPLLVLAYSQEEQPVAYLAAKGGHISGPMLDRCVSARMLLSAGLRYDPAHKQIVLLGPYVEWDRNASHTGESDQPVRWGQNHSRIDAIRETRYSGSWVPKSEELALSQEWLFQIVPTPKGVPIPREKLHSMLEEPGQVYRTLVVGAGQIDARLSGFEGLISTSFTQGMLLLNPGYQPTERKGDI